MFGNEKAFLTEDLGNYKHRTRGSSWRHDPEEVLCIGTNTLARFGNPCDVPLRSSGIARSPHNENKEEELGKNMSTEANKKATAATSATIDELFHEAMRSYEKALKSGFNCRRNQ